MSEHSLLSHAYDVAVTGEKPSLGVKRKYSSPQDGYHPSNAKRFAATPATEWNAATAGAATAIGVAASNELAYPEHVRLMATLSNSIDRDDREKIEALLLHLESRALRFSTVAPGYETLFSSFNDPQELTQVGIELSRIILTADHKNKLKPGTWAAVRRGLGFKWTAGVKRPKHPIEYSEHIALMAKARITIKYLTFGMLGRVLFSLENSGIALSQLMPHSNNGDLHPLQEYFDALSLSDWNADASRATIGRLFGLDLRKLNLGTVAKPEHRELLDCRQKPMSRHARILLHQFLAFLEKESYGTLPDMIHRHDMTALKNSLTKAIGTRAVRSGIYKVLADHFALEVGVGVSIHPHTLTNLKHVLLLHSMHDTLGTVRFPTFRRILWLIESKRKTWDNYADTFRQERDKSSAHPDPLLHLQNFLGTDREYYPPDSENVLERVLQRCLTVNVGAAHVVRILPRPMARPAATQNLMQGQ